MKGGGKIIMLYHQIGRLAWFHHYKLSAFGIIHDPFILNFQIKVKKFKKEHTR